MNELFKIIPAFGLSFPHHGDLLAGNYDLIQHPVNISDTAMKSIPFYMFVDEETEAYMKNTSVLDNKKRVGLWRIIVVHNNPYGDARRNGKVSLLWFG